MAPKTLSAFLSPISLPHHLTQFNPKFLKINTKPTRIFCKSAQSHKTPLSETQLSVSMPEAGGAGAAAPTPGEQFLERQKAFEAAKLVMKEAKKKKRREKQKALKVNSAVVCCYGCGAPLQTSEQEAPGYVDPDTYELVWR